MMPPPQMPDDNELIVGSLAWTRVENIEPAPSLWCEAPRHVGVREAPARWMIRGVVDGETIWQATCETCMNMVCADLGVTPEQGATNV